MNDLKPTAPQQALARRRAQLIMQVQSGLLSAQEAARQLRISRKTYYKWERRALAAMVEALGIPVILISQLRKLLKGEDRRQPTLQRLYGTGAKPKHASIVVHVDREFVREMRGDQSKACLCVLKNRDGLN
jgi:hypothetical protein